jgi:hypothetical protein
VRVRCSRKRTQTLAQELYRQQRGKIQQSLGHRVDVANSTSINPVSDALPCIAITEEYVPPMYKMQYEGREGSPYCFFKSPGFEGLAPASRCSHFSSFFSELRRRALRSAQKIHVNKPMLQATKIRTATTPFSGQFSLSRIRKSGVFTNLCQSRGRHGHPVQANPSQTLGSTPPKLTGWPNVSHVGSGRVTRW